MCDEVRKIAYGIMNRFKGYLPKSAVVGNYEEYLRTFSKYPEILSGICPCDAESLFITGPCGEKLKVILYEYCKEKQNAIELRNELNEKNEELEKEIKELEFEIGAMEVADKYAKFLRDFEQAKRRELQGGGLRNNVDKAIQGIDDAKNKHRDNERKLNAKHAEKTAATTTPHTNISAYIALKNREHENFIDSHIKITAIPKLKKNYEEITKKFDGKYLFVIIMFFNIALLFESYIDTLTRNPEIQENLAQKYKIQEEIIEAEKQKNIMEKAIENLESELKRLNDIDISGENCEKFRKAYGEKGMEKLEKMRSDLHDKIGKIKGKHDDFTAKVQSKDSDLKNNEADFYGILNKDDPSYGTMKEKLDAFSDDGTHKTHNALREMYYSLRKFMEETEEINNSEYNAFFLKDKPTKSLKGGRFPKYRLTS